uniref:Uncharacterized protein n=1 Tax=Aegilops tauschii subsp. strangulata TaxID=200361 RepID=A0A453INX3_AEGTS
TTGLVATRIRCMCFFSHESISRSLPGDEQGEPRQQPVCFLLPLDLLMPFPGATTSAALASGLVNPSISSCYWSKSRSNELAPVPGAADLSWLLGVQVRTTRRALWAAAPTLCPIRPLARRIRPSARSRRTCLSWIKGWAWLMANFPGHPARPSALEAGMWRRDWRLQPASRTTPPSPAAAVARRIRARHSVQGAWSSRRDWRLQPSSRTTPSSPAAAVVRRIRARHSVLEAWSCRRHGSATGRRPSSRAAPCSPHVTAAQLRRTPPSA